MRLNTCQLPQISIMPGIDYYGSPIGRKRDHYIFATTSGIILPEDYYGSKFFEEILPISELAAQSDKNPKREEYFKALANVQGRPRHYYFELNRASLAFKATIQRLKDYRGEHECEKYRQESIKTISRFLQTPHFELLGVNQFPPHYDHLTLGNGRQLLLSGRDKASRKSKIGHGLYVRPRSSDFAGVLAKVKKFGIKDWGTSFGLWLGGVGGIAASHQERGAKLVEVLLSGFVAPLLVGLWEHYNENQALDMILDMHKHIDKASKDVEIVFENHPGDIPLNETQAKERAQKILYMLERGKSA